MNKKDYVTEEQDLGLNETVTVQVGTVYLVKALGPLGLVTTSGRLGVSTLDEVTAIIISDFGPRQEDWVIELNGVVQRTVHIDDSVTTP